MLVLSKNINPQKHFYFSSPLGVLKVQIKNSQLLSLSLASSQKKACSLQMIKKQGSLSLSIHDQLNAYFKGQLKRFSIPLCLDQGTPFYKKVWKKLASIPYGTTTTYQNLALKLGYPQGARALGLACSQNPFLIIVPCHRVVAKKNLGGYVLGLKSKKFLLTLEQNHPV